MNLFSKYISIPIIILVLIPIVALTTFPLVKADSSEEQTYEKWNDKCDKAIDKDSQDGARKADRQYDEHAPEGPLVQCLV
jgi:hypothetical protein